MDCLGQGNPLHEVKFLARNDILCYSGYLRITRRVGISEEHRIFRNFQRDVAFQSERRSTVNAIGKIQSSVFRETVYRGLYTKRIVGNSVALRAKIFDVYGAGLLRGLE